MMRAESRGKAIADGAKRGPSVGFATALDRCLTTAGLSTVPDDGEPESHGHTNLRFPFAAPHDGEPVEDPERNYLHDTLLDRVSQCFVLRVDPKPEELPWTEETLAMAPRPAA